MTTTQISPQTILGTASNGGLSVGTMLPAPARDNATPNCRTPSQDTCRDGQPETNQGTTPRLYTSLADPFLKLAADVLDDTEQTRIANENRLRQLTRTEEDSDGIERGFGLTEDHPDVARLATLVKALADIEHQATLNLNRLLRQHPLHPWLKAQKGVGDKQAARLLAVIGDPYWHDGQNRPRQVSELWSYCGHGDPTRRPAKGMTQADMFKLGSPLAKMRVHLIMVSSLKAGGPYADAYRDRKASTEGRLHNRDCKRCGPSGHPAITGTPWSDGHRHADALRVAGKHFLRDLWAQAQHIHHTTQGQHWVISTTTGSLND